VKRFAKAVAALGLLAFVVAMALPFLPAGDLYRGDTNLVVYALIALAKVLLLVALLLGVARREDRTWPPQ
jgi:hypothetical protein